MASPTTNPVIQQFLLLKLKDQLAYLSKLRETDPAAALRLVQSIWAQSEASARKAYLETFRINLNLADEAFLESVLDDRGNSIRANAAHLLSALANSRLTRRMTNYAAAHLEYLSDNRPDIPDQIHIILPTSYKTEWKRDAIAEKAIFPVVSYPFFWLTQIISRVPPNTWTRRWRKIAPQVLRAAFSTDTYGEKLVTAFINATVLHHDPEWAESLLMYNLESLTAYTPQYLITLVPQNRRERVVENALTSHPIVHPVQGLPPYFFWWLEKSWSKRFSRFVLDRLIQYTNPNSPADPTILPTIRLIAEGIHPSVYPHARSHLSSPNPIHPYLADPITALLQTLKTRHDQLSQ